MKCPHCKATIDHLYAEPPVPKEVTLTNDNQLEYEIIDPDRFEPNEFLCPKCMNTICKDEDEAIAFLKECTRMNANTPKLEAGNPYIPNMCFACLIEKRPQLRDSDAKCLICGANLCGGHIMEHLKNEHCVGDHLYEVKQ